MRLFRALWNKFWGWVTGKAEGIEEDADVIAATFDASIAKGKARLDKTKQAVAKLMTIADKKQLQLNTLSKSIEKLTQVRSAATAKATSIVETMKAQGVTAEQIGSNPDVIRATKAYNDAGAELSRKLAESKTKETELHTLQDNLANMKANLQSIYRNADSLREEKEGAVADVITAKEQAMINDLYSGVSREGSDQALERAREARRNVVSRAKLTTELAGLEAGAQGDEYLQYAESVAANSEFAALIGLETKPVSEKLSPAQLPDT